MPSDTANILEPAAPITTVVKACLWSIDRDGLMVLAGNHAPVIARADDAEHRLHTAQSALMHQGARGYPLNSEVRRRMRESHLVATVTQICGIEPVPCEARPAVMRVKTISMPLTLH